MSALLHIAPQLPPAVDGVGDYCWHLWRHWPESTGEWAFAAMGNLEATRQHWPEAHLFGFRPNATSVLEAISSAGAQTVVLHYVGYGYNPKGVPLWLPRALEHWRSRTSGRLVTMFHEMYADSTPLRSPFWVKPWARQVIRRLVGASDAWITSCERYANQLVREFGASEGQGTRIPIAANIPTCPALSEDRLWPLGFGRKLRVAVFGLPNTRLSALQRHGGLLRELVSAELVDSVLLVGKSDSSRRHSRMVSKCQRQIGGDWRNVFDLPPAQVAEALSECDIGLVANDTDTLTKSGVFAALSANGVVSIVARRAGGSVPQPFNDCVLLNDESAGFPAIVSELRGNDRMIARRRATLRAARTTLSWTTVSQAFFLALQTPHIRASSWQSSNVGRKAPAIGKSEVRV